MLSIMTLILFLALFVCACAGAPKSFGRKDWLMRQSKEVLAETIMELEQELRLYKHD